MEKKETKHNGKYLTIKTSPCLCGPVFHHITLWKWTAGKNTGFLIGCEAKNLLKALDKVAKTKPLKLQGSYLRALITTGHQVVGSWDQATS